MNSPKKRNVLKIVAVIKKDPDTGAEEEEGSGWGGPRRSSRTAARTQAGKVLAIKRASSRTKVAPRVGPKLAVKKASSKTTSKAASKKTVKK